MAAPVPPCTPRSSRSQPADGRSDSFRSRDHGHCNSGQPHRRDPHAAKPFRRLFLGPMPVPASAAAATAAALAEDAATTDPVGIAVVGRKGTAVVGSREGSIASPSVAGRPSYSRSIGPSSASHPRSPSRSQSIDTAGSPPTSPLQRRVRELSPFSRNASSGAGHLDLPSSHASGAGARSRHMTRDVSGTSLASVRSFVSAKSMPSSVLSEGDAAARLPQRNMKGKPRREASTGSALGLGVPPSSGFSGAGLGLVRRASSKSEADESAYRSEEREGRRRRRSSSEWHHGWDSSHHGGPVLPLLDLPVTEADESVTPGEEVELLDMANGTGKGQGAGTIDQDKSDEDRLHPHDYAVPSGSPSRRGGSPLRSNAWRSLRTPSVPSVDHGTSSSIASQGRRAGSLDSTHARGYPMGSPSNTRAKHLASTSLSARRGSPASSLTRAQGKAYAQSSVGADEDPTLTTDEATPGQGGQSRRASLATQGTDGGSPFTGRTQRLKERARQRFSQGPAPRALIARQQSAGQGSLHARDFSQRSRMSRASTVGTINTMGTFGTDGSFGASGGMRSRLLALGGPLAGSYRGQQREGGPDYEDGRITAAKDRSVRRKHRTRKGSLTEGAHSGVGTSAGGTKWVGHSFEIGKRFWEVLDAQQARPEVDGLESGVEGDTSQAMFSGARSERQPSVDQTHEAQLRVSPASKQRPSLKVDTAQTQQGAQTAVAQGDQTSGREVQSPGGVLSTMADEANQAAETKKVAGSITGSDQHTPTARQQAFAGQAGDSTLDVPGSPQSTRTAQSLGTTTGTMMTRDQSVASLVTLQQSPDAETTFDIENRHGWSDVVSFITASSGGPSSIASRATRPTLGSIGSSSAGRRRLPILSSRPAYQQPSIIREASGSSQNQEGRDDVSMRTEDRVDHMSQQDTLKHPDPPISADERFPEITLDLLRRPSDSTDLPVTGETASDHEVAARSSPPPNPNAALGQDLVSSPDRLHGWSTANALPTQGTTLSTLASVDAPPRRSSRSPLLATSFTTSPAPSEVESPAQEPDVDARARTRSRGGTPKRKKTVQFRDSPEASGGRPTPLRSLSTGFFNRSSPPASGSSAKLGTQLPVHAHASPATAGSGDADPRPPEEVLNRPHPTSRPRTPGDTPGSDDQAKRHVEEQEIITRKTVLKRDRMLAKVEWSQAEDLPPGFDELAARKYSIYPDKWREYIIILRMGKLEMWSDPTFASKAIGHPERLKLRFSIPLRRGSTYLSLYSPIDRIFCLTCPPWNSSHHPGEGHKKSLLHLRRTGTNIIIFDARARTVAADWMCEIWRELGGLIPANIDVRLPAFDLRVRIPIPDEVPCHVDDSDDAVHAPGSGPMALHSSAYGDGREGFRILTRDRLIATVENLAAIVPDWHDLLEYRKNQGYGLELAWRRGTVLDWVTEETTVDGKPREWAVLSGIVLKQVKDPNILELRTAVHYPTSVRTVSGESLDEPPAVEGYLWRVKPVSGALTRLYLTTHDGHAFICRSSRAYPPDRHLATAANDTLDMRIPRTAAQAGAGIEKPRHKGVRRAFDRLLGREKSVRREETMANLRQQVMETVTTFATTAEEVQARIDAYRAFEKRRQFEQINGADGYVDLRDIRAIRRVGDGLMRRPSFEDKRAAPRSKSAKSEAHSATGSGAKVEEDAANAGSDEEEFSDGEADVGGEEGLAASKDRAALRQMRQFEVVMKNGRSTRFETYSKQVAREWIDRLSDLARYWKRREKVDALELMNVSGFDPALIHRHKQERSNPRSLSLTPDMDTIAPMLGSLWHWCAIQGCRGIIRCGRLFHKKKLHAPFRSRYYILIAGRLLHYKLVTTTSSARSRQNAGIFHRRQETVVHLRDAYVFSGQLTEDLLQNGRTEGAQGINNIGGGGGANAGERHKLPRVYQDGLLSVDEDEDCSFVVRYRPEHKNADVISPGITSTPAADGAKPNASPSALPTLSDKKHKYLVLRARSKMERDLWVRAISYETEREARLNADREMRLKTVGTVDR